MEKTVSVKKLTHDAFRIYGDFANMTEPSGPKMGFGPVEFYRDMAILSLGQVGEAAFSVTRVQKRDNIVDAMECHHHTGEACLPLDGDILMHVAPACGTKDVPLDKIEVFRVPKGTLVVLRPGVWHCAPFAEKTDFVDCMVVLPERTYNNDIFFYRMTKEEQLRIV